MWRLKLAPRNVLHFFCLEEGGLEGMFASCLSIIRGGRSKAGPGLAIDQEITCRDQKIHQLSRADQN